MDQRAISGLSLTHASAWEVNRPIAQYWPGSIRQIRGAKSVDTDHHGHQTAAIPRPQNAASGPMRTSRVKREMSFFGGARPFPFALRNVH